MRNCSCCNNKNEIKLKEEHAGIKPFLSNYSIHYSNVASAIDELVRHFYHLEYLYNFHAFQLKNISSCQSNHLHIYYHL